MCAQNTNKITRKHSRKTIFIIIILKRYFIDDYYKNVINTGIPRFTRHSFNTINLISIYDNVEKNLFVQKQT